MIKLVPMTEAELQNYLAHAIEDYAQDHVKAGDWDAADARERSRREFEQLLPNGVASPKQHLFTAIDTDTNQSVGMIWFAERTQGNTQFAFIYDFVIREDLRGKGFGKQTLLALEDEVKKAGLNAISLHVFGHNKTAFNLYQNTGFEVTHALMTKRLNQP